VATNTPDPWERQLGEHIRRFAAFQIYRDAGSKRSLRACARQCGKSAGLLERWSRQNDWQKRVLLWDAWQDELKREAMAAEIQVMAKRQADLAVMFLSKVLDRLRVQITDPATGETVAGENVSLADAARVFDIATKVERTARGIAPMLAGASGPALSDDEIRKMDLTELDLLQRALRVSARSGDVQAVDRTVKIMERRAQLLGLDAPQQLTHRGGITISEVIIERPVEAGGGQDSPDSTHSTVGGAKQ
jgi:hypothetical protein